MRKGKLHSSSKPVVKRACSRLAAGLLAFLITGSLATGASAAITEYLFSTEESLIPTDRPRLRPQQVGKYFGPGQGSETSFDGAVVTDQSIGLIATILQLVLGSEQSDFPKFTSGGHINALHVVKDSVEPVTGRTQTYFLSVDEPTEVQEVDPSLLPLFTPPPEEIFPWQVVNLVTQSEVPTAGNVENLELFPSEDVFWEQATVTPAAGVNMANIDAFYQGLNTDVLVMSVREPVTFFKKETRAAEFCSEVVSETTVTNPLTGETTTTPASYRPCSNTYYIEQILPDGTNGKEFLVGSDDPFWLTPNGAPEAMDLTGLAQADGNDLIVFNAAAAPGAAGSAGDVQSTLLVDLGGEFAAEGGPSDFNVTGVHVAEYNVNALSNQFELCQLSTSLTVDNCLVLFTVDKPIALGSGTVFTEKDVIQYDPSATGSKFSKYRDGQVDMREAMDGDVGREQMYALSLNPLPTASIAALDLTDTASAQTLLVDDRSIYFSTTSEDQIATHKLTVTSLELSSREILGTDHEGTITSPLSRAHHFNFDAVHRLASDENVIVFSTQDPIVVSDGIASARESSDLFQYSGGAISDFSTLDGNPLPSWPADLDAVTLDDKEKELYFSIRLADPASSVAWGNMDDPLSPPVSPADIVLWSSTNTPNEGGEIVFRGQENFVSPDEDIDALHWFETDRFLISVAEDAELRVPAGTLGSEPASDGNGVVLKLSSDDLVEVELKKGEVDAAAIVSGVLLPDEIRMSNLLPGADPYSDSVSALNLDAIWVREVKDSKEIDHYEIVHGEPDATDSSVGTGTTCAPADVTIVAAGKLHDLFTDADTVIRVTADDGSGSPIGEWSLKDGFGVFVNEGLHPNGDCDAGTPDDGVACYEYVPGTDALSEDGGTVTLSLLHRVTGTVDISVTDGTATELTGTSLEIHNDPSIVFGTSTIKIAERKDSTSVPMGATGYPADSTGDSYVDLEIAGKPSDIAPYGEANNVLGGMYVRSVGSDLAGGCLAILNAEGMEMAFECDRAGGCVGAEAVTIDGTPISQYPAYTAVDVEFDAEGIAPFVFSYPDSGRLKLHARVALGASGDMLEGVSNAFVVRPFAFRVADGNIASGTAATVKTSPNPGGTAYGGDGFVSSGSAFDVKIEAIAWQAGDDPNFDGRPDSLALINDNGLTRDFSVDVFPDDLVSVSLQSDTYTPSDGRRGDLRTVSDPDPNNADAGLAGSFAGGEATLANLAYTEVGSIRLDVSALQYQCLGTDEMNCTDPAYSIFGETGDIGRFFPDSISINGGSATDSCGDPDGFTYMDDPSIQIGFTLIAENRFGDRTHNYDDTPDSPLPEDGPHPAAAADEQEYSSAFTGTVTLAAEEAGGASVSDRIGLISANLAEPIWEKGRVTYFASNHAFARDAAPDGPYTVQLGLDWTAGTDPVDLAPLNLAGGTATSFGETLDVRFGRLNLQAAYGSETQTIQVPLTTEYWDGVAWKLNTDDNCTQLQVADFTVTGSGVDPEPGDPMTVGVGDGPGPSTASYNSSTPTMNEGDAGLQLSPPGAGNTGHVDIRVVADDWLKFDWSGNGLYNEDPNEVRIIFGRYRGQDRVIYWREQFQ